MRASERKRVSPALPFATFLILLFAMILLPAGAAGQSISIAAVGPTRVDFGPQAPATKSEMQVVILSNAGSDALPITKIVPKGDFAVHHDCPGLLPAGEECRIWLSFKPSAVGVREGQLTITDGAGTQRVDLLGTGTPVLKASQ